MYRTWGMEAKLWGPRDAASQWQLLLPQCLGNWIFLWFLILFLFGPTCLPFAEEVEK